MPLEDLQKYVAGLTPITAKDMNTLGKVVEMVRGIAGDDFYVDAGGVVRRKAPGKRETRTVRLTSLAGSGYEWKEVAPKADGTFVDVSGGLLSSDMGQAIDPTGDNAFTADTSTGDVVTIRRDVDPDTGDTLWVIVAGSTTGGATTTYLQNTATVGTYDTLNMHSSLSTVYKFEAVAAAGTNGARADLKLIPSTAYYVVQMDSTATKLILAPCRGI